MSKLLTIEEVAEWLKCSDDQVRVLIRNGELPYVNIGAGKLRLCIRVAEDSLTAFLKCRTADPAQPRRKPRPKPMRDWV